MHETLLKCKCDAMHEHLRSLKQHPTQKFCKNLIHFEKPQNLLKTSKVGSKRDEMHDKCKEEDHTKRRNHPKAED